MAVANARVTQVAAEVLILSNPNARVTQVAVEVLVGPVEANARLTQLAVEALIQNVDPATACSSPWTFPTPNPFPFPSIGGPQYKRFQEMEPSWGEFEVEFPDKVKIANTAQTSGIRHFQIDYEGLTEAEARTLDQHYISTRGGISFSMTVPRTGEALTKVRYEKYEVVPHTKKWAQIRRVILIKATNS